MSFAESRRKLKPWMLPIAMVSGVVFHDAIGWLSPLSPALIFVMLLLTYSRLSVRDFRGGGFIGWLLAAQIGGAIAAYMLLSRVSEVLAQGAFICVICPTATAAPVVTGMLGGSVPRVATYSLFSNLAVAAVLPPLLSWINPGADVPFADTLTKICLTVLPLISGPLIVSALMAHTVPSLRQTLARHQALSFYIWAFSLIIVVGNAVSFVMREPAEAAVLMSALCVVSLLACVIQFAVGRAIGRRYGDPVSGSQSLGQKNTVLAVWLALSYLHPLASVAPAAYIAWHNLFNSLQIYLHDRRREQSA